MPKKKIVAECLVDYLFEKDKYKGRLQVHSFFTVDAEYTSYPAMGNETWEWAQKNWPDFIAEEGPTVIIDEIEIPSILRWCCVTGVKGLNDNDLPFVNGYTTSTKKPTNKRVTSSNNIIRSKTPNKSPKLTPVPTPAPKPKKQVTNFEEYKAQKIKEAMEEE